MRPNLTYILAFAFTVFGLSIAAFKAWKLDYPLLPHTTSESWHVEAQLSYAAGNKPIKASLYLPRFSQGISIVDENFISDGYGFSTKIDSDTGNRTAKWTKRRAGGREVLFYRAIIYRANTDSFSADVKPDYNPITYGTEAFSKLAETDPTYIALSSIIQEVQERSADSESFAEGVMRLLQKKIQDERIRRIQEDEPELKKNSYLAAFILNQAGFPARVMNGIALENSMRDAGIISWVEMYQDAHWKMVNASLPVPANTVLLPWWSGINPPYAVSGVRHPGIKLSVKRQLESELTESIWKGDRVSQIFYAFSVYRLPINVQMVFSVLLLVPIGCLVIVILRQVIGIKPFGTFSPVLIAMSFRETQLFWGIVLFSCIVLMGMLFRTILNRLQLLMVPRLASVLVGVVISIYLLNLFTFDMGITAGLSISLFPIVILVMIIERMSVMWDESGYRDASRACISTLFAAILCYLSMYNDISEHVLVTFPELLLVFLSAIMLLGRYNGFKLTEYKRFRAIDLPKKPSGTAS